MNKFQLSSFVVFILTASTMTWAGVYQCQNAKGVIEFRDKPCETGSEIQTFLPTTYTKTHQKMVKVQEKNIQKKHQILKRQDKQMARAEKLARKKTEKEKLKAQRIEAKCVKVNDKINQIESRLRLGCKVGQNHRLKEQLQHYAVLKQQYCQP